MTTYLTTTEFGAGGSSGGKSFKENLNRSKAVQTDSKGLEEASSSPLGPGCREFESRHSDQKCYKSYLRFIAFFDIFMCCGCIVFFVLLCFVIKSVLTDTYHDRVLMQRKMPSIIKDAR